MRSSRAARRRAHQQLLGQPPAQLAHHARRPDAPRDLEAAREQRARRPSRAASATSEPASAASGARCDRRGGDHVRQQRRLGDDRRPPSPRPARRRARAARAPARLSRSRRRSTARPARGGGVPVPSRPASARVAARAPRRRHRGRRASLLLEHRDRRRRAVEVLATEAVAEDPVGPALVGEHDRHEDDRDDRHHDQRVVRRGRRRPASGRRRGWSSTAARSGRARRTGSRTAARSSRR